MAMTKREKKIAQLIVIYIGMTVILTLIGVMIGHAYLKKDGISKAKQFGLYGFILGVVLSIVLYFTIGKKEIEKASSTDTPLKGGY